MLSDQQLLELFRLEESDRLERKESLSDRDKIRQAICALANDLPNSRQTGVVFIGQRDDRSCAGISISQYDLTVLAGFAREGKILPFPAMSVRKAAVDGCEVAVIEVEPSDNPPVRVDGRIWVRRGPSRGIATDQEETRLVEKRRWGSLPFDAHGVRGATLADLDLKRFELEYRPAVVSPEALEQNHRSQVDQLRALRLLHQDGTPTVTAILMLGTDPRHWFPGAYIQFLRVNGRELTDELIDQRELSGPLPDQLRLADELVRINLRTATAVGGAVRVDSVDYPEEALRQLIRNAVIHRTYEGTNAPVRITWYEDRIEIQSPGGPYGQVTKPAFGEPGVVDYRNPTIVEALKSLGFVERFGVGIAIARKRLAENGNPAPAFTVEDAHVLATVFQKP